MHCRVEVLEGALDRSREHIVTNITTSKEGAALDRNDRITKPCILQSDETKAMYLQHKKLSMNSKQETVHGY